MVGSGAVLMRIALVVFLPACTILLPIAGGVSAHYSNTHVDEQRAEEPLSDTAVHAYRDAISAAQRGDCDAAIDHVETVQQHDTMVTSWLLRDPRLGTCRDPVGRAHREPASLGARVGVGLLVGLLLDAAVVLGSLRGAS